MSNRKVAFITGSGAGIGKAIAIRLAKDGYDIAINDLREEFAKTAAEEVKAIGVNCIVIPGDVSDEKTVKAMFEKLMSAYGRLDVLVNNAGVCPIRKMDKIVAADMERTFNINVVSMLLCSQEAVEIMKKQGEGGRIINAASQSAFRETPVTFEYTTTKWAIRGMTRTMAASLAKYNITVNAYCPGTVITEMQDKIAKAMAKEMKLPAKLVRTYQLKTIPLGRFQTVDDIAGLVSFFASDRAKNMTGQSILVNGGYVMN